MTTSPRIGPRIALVVATVLVGLSAGFFFTYEASVTLGLADVSDLAYVETFQALNATIRNPAFGIVFFGAIVALVGAIVTNWAATGGAGRLLLAAALPLYLTGLAITATGNVPLNEELATVERLTAESVAPARADFEDDWNRLNLLRTLAIGGSFVAMVTVGALGPSGVADETGAGVSSGHTG